MRAASWLALANILWLLGGALAYATRASLVLATAIALVPALPALLDMRRASPGLWLDRALAAALGTWAVMAILIVTPYMATEGGVSLWTSRSFAATGLAVASVGMMLWNVAAFLAIRGPPGTARLYAGFHVLVLAAALYVVATGDGGRSAVELRGQAYDVVDLRLAPLVASLAAIPWAAAFFQMRTQPRRESDT